MSINENTKKAADLTNEEIDSMSNEEIVASMEDGDIPEKDALDLAINTQLSILSALMEGFRSIDGLAQEGVLSASQVVLATTMTVVDTISTSIDFLGHSYHRKTGDDKFVKLAEKIKVSVERSINTTH